MHSGTAKQPLQNASTLLQPWAGHARRLINEEVSWEKSFKIKKYIGDLFANTTVKA
jgi:hypothetical protein